MNIIKHTDSYKLSHFKQYPKDVNYVSSYIEARYSNTDEIRTDKVVFFGLQAYIKKYLMNTSFSPRDIDLAARVAALHGEPFNEEGWKKLYSYHGGFLPLEIEAIPEGSVVPLGTPLVQIRNTDPDFPWLTNYVETSLLRAIWYPTTVATLSYSIKQMMRKYWNDTVEDSALSGIDFALHDFGARGVSSSESAALGGMSHLLSFNGSDTVESLYAADEYYPEFELDTKERKNIPFGTGFIAGYSVPAAEHSTITSWGKDNEDEAIKNMVVQFGGEGRIYSVVSDSYDLFDAVNRISSGSIVDLVRQRGGRFVIRPDSGEPVSVIKKVFEILENNLRDEITINSKGFKVLPPYFRVIQGDGVNHNSIENILINMMYHGWSSENIVFGMGGALLQKVNRDTLGFAMKCNAVSKDAVCWYDIAKKPKTDALKTSKPGRIFTGLDVVYQNGLSFNQTSFSTLKKRVQNS